MRNFEKISFEQFKRDVRDDLKLYKSYLLPRRNSKKTAGYDIYLLDDVVLEPREVKRIPTGIKCCYEDDVVLFLVVRSSVGFKYNIRLCNQVGVIDADYYNNLDNEGHIFICVQNESDKKWEFKRGDALVQGIFVKYLTTDDDMTMDLVRRSDY